MAITATATVLDSTAELPDPYTKPPLPSVSGVGPVNYTGTVAITEADPANATTGLNNVLAAIETDFVTTTGPTTFGLNPTDTITVAITVRKITRGNTQPTADGGVFITGTEQYEFSASVEWEVA